MRICLIHPYPSRYLLDSLDAAGFDVLLLTAPGAKPSDRPGVIELPLHNEAAVGERVRTEHGQRPLAAIVPFHEGTTGLVARLSEQLSLPGVPPAAAEASRNKYLAFQRWSEAGLSVPRTVVVANEEGWRQLEAEIGYPAVIKLADSMNSQGVALVRSREELLVCQQRLHELLGRPLAYDVRDDRNRMAYGRGEIKVIAQEFCTGVEVGVDLLYHHDRYLVLGVFEKAPALGPFFAETMSVSPTSLGEAREAELGRLAHQAVLALGGTRGAAHVEIRLAGDGARLLEAGLRPGGGYTMQAVERLTGINLPSALTRLVLGEGLPAPVARSARAALYGGIVYPQSGVLRRATGLTVLAETPGLLTHAVLHQPGDRVYCLPESAQPHFAYYLLEADDRQTALIRHRRIQEAINLDIAAFETGLTSAA